MRHVTPLSRNRLYPVSAEFNILGTRALVSLLSDIVGFLSGASALFKGAAGDGGEGNGEGEEDDGHVDDH